MEEEAVNQKRQERKREGRDRQQLNMRNEKKNRKSIKSEIDFRSGRNEKLRRVAQILEGSTQVHRPLRE